MTTTLPAPPLDPAEYSEPAGVYDAILNSDREIKPAQIAALSLPPKAKELKAVLTYRNKYSLRDGDIHPDDIVMLSNWITATAVAGDIANDEMIDEPYQLHMSEILAAAISHKPSASLRHILPLLWPAYYQSWVHDLKGKDPVNERDVFSVYVEKIFVSAVHDLLHELVTKHGYTRITAEGSQFISTDDLAASMFKKFKHFHDTWGEELDFQLAPRLLPIDKLPPAIQSIIKEITKQQEVDQNMTTAAVLSALSIANLNTVRIELDKRRMFALYSTVILAESGERKTDTYEEILKPLKEFEKREISARNKELLSFYNKELREAENELKELTTKRAVSKALGAAAPPTGHTASGAFTTSSRASELEEYIEHLQGEKRLVFPIRQDDVTPEELIRSMSQCLTGFTYIRSDDTDVFKKASGGGSGKSSLAAKFKVFLDTMLGGSLTHRTKTGAELIADEAGMVVLSMTQPKIFMRYVLENSDAADSGFLPRFNAVYVTNKYGVQPKARYRASASSVHAWENTLRGMLTVAVNHIEKERRASEDERAKLSLTRRAIECPRDQVPPRVVTVSEEIADAHNTFCRDVWQVTARKGNKYHAIKPWVSKAEDAMIVLTTLFTLADNPNATEVTSMDYYEAAQQITVALAEHGMYALDTSDAEELRSAYEHIRAYAKKQGVTCMKQTDIGGRVFKGKDAATVQRYLHRLAEMGKLREEKPPRRHTVGRTPASKWHIRPEGL